VPVYVFSDSLIVSRAKGRNPSSLSDDMPIAAIIGRLRSGVFRCFLNSLLPLPQTFEGGLKGASIVSFRCFRGKVGDHRDYFSHPVKGSLLVGRAQDCIQKGPCMVVRLIEERSHIQVTHSPRNVHDNHYGPYQPGEKTSDRQEGRTLSTRRDGQKERERHADSPYQRADRQLEPMVAHH